MKEDLKGNKEWIELRANLQSVEKKILCLMEINGWILKKEIKGEVEDLLSDRCDILNKMFRLHVTEQEVARFREVNDRLLKLTRQMFSEHNDLLGSIGVHYLESIVPEIVVQVDSVLDVDANGEVLCFDDDNDYCSNFAEMFDALAWTDDLDIHSCITNLGDKPEPDSLDDGTTWAEGCLVLPQIEDIIVCYAVHDVCTHKNYSIPDLLRIPSYSIHHTIDGTSKQSV